MNFEEKLQEEYNELEEISQLNESAVLDMLNVLLPMSVFVGGAAGMIKLFINRFNMDKLYGRYYPDAGVSFYRLNDLTSDIDSLTTPESNEQKEQLKREAAKEISKIERNLSKVANVIAADNNYELLDKWTTKIEPKVQKDLNKVKRKYRI